MIIPFKNRDRLFLIFSISIIIGIGFSEGRAAQIASPVRLGCPLPLGFVYGRAAERGIRLDVEEVNAGGGVNVGGSGEKSSPFRWNLGKNMSSIV